MTSASKSTQGKNKESQKSSREIESEIEETRTAISGDINALSEKFTPAHMKEEAKEAVSSAKNAVADKAVEVKDAVVDKAVEMKDAASEKAVELKDQASEALAQAKEVASETIEQVTEEAQEIGSAAWQFTKANAVPLALVGVGAGWMIANSRNRGPEYYEVETPTSYTVVEDEYGYTEPLGSSRVGAARVSARTDERSRPSARRPTATRKATSRNRQPMRSLASQAGDRARRAEEMISRRAAEGTKAMRRGWDRVRTRTTNFAEDRPLVAALGVLAAGIGIGMLLPASERENKLLEPARNKVNQLMGDARQAASDIARTAKETASDTVHALS